MFIIAVFVLVEAFAAQAVQEKAQLLNFLPKLPSVQPGWLLLYFCAVPRINHLLRTVPPDVAEVFAGRHDATIQSTFMAIFGIADEETWDVNLHKTTFESWVRQAQYTS